MEQNVTVKEIFLAILPKIIDVQKMVNGEMFLDECVDVAVNAKLAANEIWLSLQGSPLDMHDET